MARAQRQGTLIFNPNAGLRDWTNAIEQFAAFWKERGWSMEVESTEHAGHATELASAAVEAGHTMIFGAGGDGTLNEIANALVGTDVTLAPLPVGTANVLAQEIGLRKPNLLAANWMTDVSESLARGRIQHMDVGQNSTGRYWLLQTGTGIDGYIVNQIEPRPQWSKRLGKFGYLITSLPHLSEFRSPHAVVTVDGETFEGEFLMVTAANTRTFFGGELNLNQAGVFDDGQFEVWIFSGREWPRLAAYALNVVLEQEGQDPGITLATGSSMEIRCEPALPYHVDGEPVGDTPYSCRLVKQALSILVPDSVPEGLFSRPGEALGV